MNYVVFISEDMFDLNEPVIKVKNLTVQEAKTIQKILLKNDELDVMIRYEE